MRRRQWIENKSWPGAFALIARQRAQLHRLDLAEQRIRAAASPVS